MTRINGVRSIDIYIHAIGNGVVNWNGPTTLAMESGETATNHSMPKLRGYTPYNGKVKEANGYKYLKTTHDINFKETPMYVSSNCIRFHVFKDFAFDGQYIASDNVSKALASILGLVRGYVIPSSQNMRKSCLLVEDFIDYKHNGNFEQLARFGERNASSFYSKTTFGETAYNSYASINIENLQFISLDKKFDRCAATISKNQVDELTNGIESYLKKLNPNLNPTAIYHPNYVRIGTIYYQGEAGILLNEDAMTILVDETIRRIKELYILQSKAYLMVDKLVVDYNDSDNMMRIKYQDGLEGLPKSTNFATYFVGV